MILCRFNVRLALVAFYFCFRLLFYLQHEAFHFSTKASHYLLANPTIFCSFHFSRSSYYFLVYPTVVCSLRYNVFAPIQVDNLCLSKIGSFRYRLSRMFVFNETNISSYQHDISLQMTSS